VRERETRDVNVDVKKAGLNLKGGCCYYPSNWTSYLSDCMEVMGFKLLNIF
jgi:hypothetical protein